MFFFLPADCLIELEPMLRKFDEIDVLEAVLEVKRSKVRLVVYLYICFLTINCGLVSAEMKAT